MNPHTLESFITYCDLHKDQRFWQALLNWSRAYYREKGVENIIMFSDDGSQDTYELE